MKKLLTSVVVWGIVSMLPVTAQAVCDATAAVIVRLNTFPGAAASTIYYRESALSSRYLFCTTADEKLIDVASDALGDNRVWIRGSAASCPTNTTGGGNAGACVFIIVNP